MDEEPTGPERHINIHIDPEKMAWRVGLDRVRARTRATVPTLTTPGRLPPGPRVIRTGRILGSALLLWKLKEKPKGGEQSRAGVSKRLRKAFERLGPTYIKMGQILSSGEGIFPPELVREFRFLRDKVPAEPFEVVRKTVEADLGAPLEAVFARFERTPIAAAFSTTSGPPSASVRTWWTSRKASP